MEDFIGARNRECRVPDFMVATDALMKEILQMARIAFEGAYSSKNDPRLHYATRNMGSGTDAIIGVGFKTRFGMIWVEPIAPSNKSVLGRVVMTGVRVARLRHQDGACIYGKPGRMYDVLMIVETLDKKMSITTVQSVVHT
jgi:hypothetical protein